MSFGDPGLSFSDSLSGALLSRSRFCRSPRMSLEKDSASLSPGGSARPSADGAIREGFFGPFRGLSQTVWKPAVTCLLTKGETKAQRWAEARPVSHRAWCKPEEPRSGGLGLCILCACRMARRRPSSLLAEPGWSVQDGCRAPHPLAKMALNSLSKPTCWDNRGPHGACPLRCTHTPAWQPGSGWTQPCGTDGLVPHLSLGQLPPGPPVGPALLPLCGCEDPGGQGPGWAILILGYVGQGTAGGGGKLCVQPCNLHSRGHS